jgi:hypothetical protein
VPQLVDRAQTCPFLVRVFIAKDRRGDGRHRRPDAYAQGKVPEESELHLYTWQDATLKELAGLLQEVDADARRPQAVVSFACVYPTPSGSMIVRPLGAVANRTGHPADDRTLGACNFRPGDYLDVCVSTTVPPRAGPGPGPGGGGGIPGAGGRMRSDTNHSSSNNNYGDDVSERPSFGRRVVTLVRRRAGSGDGDGDGGGGDRDGDRERGEDRGIAERGSRDSRGRGQGAYGNDRRRGGPVDLRR